jgi:polyribonucleotide nucleotidyltransferase
MIQVERDRVGEIIGQGGSVIKSIEEKSGANINISREGLVTITGNESSVNKARKIIESILVKVEYGKIVKGVISRVTESYAIVEIGDGKNGLLHISEICDSRIDCDMSDMMFEGENVVVKILPSDDSRIKLTMKGINQENGIEG